MEKLVIYITLMLIGLCLGSFAGATVWRLRARQLVIDKDNNEEYDKEEYKRLKKLTIGGVMKDRSRCLHCSYELQWYDLIPLVSWLSLGGKCRHCHTPIGCFEPLIELGLLLFFILSYAFWPYPIETAFEALRFVLWLMAGSCLAILFAYDSKWFLLPDKVSFVVIGIGVANVAVVLLQSTNISSTLMSIGGAYMILSGFYLLLYVVSRGRWIGFGDVKLGLSLALLLADWKLAFVALFAANIIGCLLVIPAMIIGKLQRNSHVPFGPFLILGFIVAQLFGAYLINAYLSIAL